MRVAAALFVVIVVVVAIRVVIRVVIRVHPVVVMVHVGMEEAAPEGV